MLAAVPIGVTHLLAIAEPEASRAEWILTGTVLLLVLIVASVLVFRDLSSRSAATDEFAGDPQYGQLPAEAGGPRYRPEYPIPAGAAPAARGVDPGPGHADPAYRADQTLSQPRHQDEPRPHAEVAREAERSWFDARFQATPQPEPAPPALDPRYAGAPVDPRYAAGAADPRYAGAPDPRYGSDAADPRYPSPDPGYRSSAPTDPRYQPSAPVDPRYESAAPGDPRSGPDPRYQPEPEYGLDPRHQAGSQLADDPRRTRHQLDPRDPADQRHPAAPGQPDQRHPSGPGQPEPRNHGRHRPDR